MGVGGPRSLLHFFIRGVQSSVPDILPHGRAEKVYILGHQPDLLAQGPDSYLPEVLPVEQDAA